MTKKEHKSFRIALYVRVSTEEQAENPEGSIKNQEQRLREFVRFKNADGYFGEVIDVFCDAGISAKDMNRPALQRLLTKVRMGEVNLVMVTDLSRFTRSTKDFGILWEFLQEHDCKFHSLKDNFDSTTAAGEMIMFTLANFAQFERKQTAERISHAFLARAKRGLYNGGSLPLGYRPDPAKPGALVVVPEEAEIVRLIFKTYLQQQTLAQTAKVLNNMKLKVPRTKIGGGGPRLEFFSGSLVQGVLKSRTYLGIRVFRSKDGFSETKASWSPIIDPDTFDRAQKILEKNRHAKKAHSKRRYPYLLTGFLTCEKCGDRLSGKSAHGKARKVPYYEHAWQTKANASLSKQTFQCEPHRISAEKIEPVVWGAVVEFLTDPKMAKEMLQIARERAHEWDGKFESEKLQQKMKSIENQSEVLAERISQLPKGLDPKSLFDQMARLQAAKTETYAQLEKAKFELEKHPEPAQFESYEKFAEQLRGLLQTNDPVMKYFVIESVVQKITVNTTGISIHFYVGQDHYERDFMSDSPTTKTAVIPKSSLGPQLEVPKNFFNVESSKRLTNGGPDPDRTGDP